MQSASAPESDRTEQLVSGIYESLFGLLNTNETFVITNESLRVLITYFSAQLRDAVREGKEDQLFAHWARQLPVARRNLLDIASQGSLPLIGGVSTPIMYEFKASELVGKCPPPTYLD